MEVHLTPELIIKTVYAHSSASISATTANGSSINMNGAANLRVVGFIGATGAGVTITAAFEHSDDDSTFVAVTDDAGNAVTYSKAASQALDTFAWRARASRLKRYVRCKITTAGGAVTASVLLEALGLKSTANADTSSFYAKLI